jgi:hypothetical protein
MKHTIKGVLYGHYDSRGGATFIESENGRDEGTDRLYAEAFCCEGYEFDGKVVSAAEEAKEICDQNFLGEAILHSDKSVLHGEDIEYEDNALPIWVKEPDGPTEEARYEIQRGGECPEGWTESQLGEDAFGIIVLIREEGTYGTEPTPFHKI